MADNVGYTPGSGATIAADDVGGVLVQRIKPAFGVDGAATDVSATNPMPVVEDRGTLVERAEALLMTLRQLLAGAGGQMPDGFGRTRISVDGIASTATLPTVTTVATVTTVTTVTKVAQLGTTGIPADLMLFAQSNTAALALRDRITVT